MAVKFQTGQAEVDYDRETYAVADLAAAPLEWLSGTELVEINGQAVGPWTVEVATLVNQVAKTDPAFGWPVFIDLVLTVHIGPSMVMIGFAITGKDTIALNTTGD